ncbi:hypothetical protein D9M72_464890 [compost metagenome]
MPGAIDSLLDRAKRKRRAGDDFGHPAGNGGIELLWFSHLVDDAEALHLGCGKPPAGQQHAHREIVRDPALEKHHAAIKRQASDAGLGQAERGLRRGYDDIAAEHHLEPAAQRITVDPGDNRNIQRAAKGEPAETVRPALAPVVEAGRLGTLQISSGAKRPFACARQHDAAYVVARFNLLPDRLQLAFGCCVHCVHPLRTV